MCSRAVFQQPYNNHHYPARCKFKLWSINEKHPFQLWCWRRLLRVPWTARRSNQSILKEINSECSLEGLMQKLKHLASWCKEPIHWKRPWCWERLRAGGGTGQLRMRWLDGITDTMDMNLSKLWRQWRTGKPGVLQSMGSQSWTQLNDWTTTYLKILRISTLWVLQNNSFYPGAFLQKAILCMEGKLWRNASKGRSDPSEPLS